MAVQALSRSAADRIHGILIFTVGCRPLKNYFDVRLPGCQSIQNQSFFRFTPERVKCRRLRGASFNAQSRRTAMSRKKWAILWALGAGGAAMGLAHAADIPQLNVKLGLWEVTTHPQVNGNL